MQSEKLWTKDFLGTCFSSLFLFLTFYMLMTTLPVYVIDGLKGKPEEIGLVATVFLISSVLCRPFTGKWLDELGRKKILFISLSLFLAATVMYFGAQSLFYYLPFASYMVLGSVWQQLQLVRLSQMLRQLIEEAKHLPISAYL